MQTSAVLHRWSMIVVVMLAGCYQPALDGDCTVRCAATSPACPEGFTCAANGRCHREGSPACGAVSFDAPVESSPGDLDGDQVVDTGDNCPAVFNPAQRDEDGDGRGDRCDSCMGFPNCPGATATCLQPDDDNDGVGDACDRTTSLTSPTVVLLKYGFDGSGPATQWLDQGDGTWVTVDHPAGGGLDKFMIGSVADANFLLDEALTPVDPSLTVEVGFRATRTDANSAITVWTSVDDFLSPPLGGVHCGPMNPGGYRFGVFARMGGIDNTVTTTAASQALTAAPYRMWARIGSSIQCGELVPPPSASVGASAGPDPRRVGLHVANTEIEVDYVIVYADPP